MKHIKRFNEVVEKTDFYYEWLSDTCRQFEDDVNSVIYKIGNITSKSLILQNTAEEKGFSEEIKTIPYPKEFCESLK